MRQVEQNHGKRVDVHFLVVRLVPEYLGRHVPAVEVVRLVCGRQTRGVRWWILLLSLPVIAHVQRETDYDSYTPRQ